MNHKRCRKIFQLRPFTFFQRSPFRSGELSNVEALFKICVQIDSIKFLLGCSWTGHSLIDFKKIYMNYNLRKEIFQMRSHLYFQLSQFGSNKLTKVRLSHRKEKKTTVFIPSIKLIITEKIAIRFFCPRGLLRADM